MKWALRELFSRSNRAGLRKALENPGLYNRAILLKLIPGLHNTPIPFRLKGGGVFRVREFMTLFVFREIFLDKCYDLPLDVEGEPVVIDVGANTGLFMLRAKQLWPRSRIYCYEPYPPNYEELLVTVSESQLSGIEAYQQGVGGKARQATLHIHPRNVGGHSILNSAASGQRVTIRLVDLRQVLDRTPHARCDLLKLDCEGAEHEILFSIDEDLAGRISRIIYEDTPGLDTERLKAHFPRHGYEVRPYRDLFLATRRPPACR